MTVKELIELNQMITDINITVRQNGNVLLDQLNIGPSEGEKPRFPTRVPRDPKYAGGMNQHNESMYKDAAYITKSVNSWDDGIEQKIASFNSQDTFEWFVRECIKPYCRESEVKE